MAFRTINVQLETEKHQKLTDLKDSLDMTWGEFLRWIAENDTEIREMYDA